MNVQIRKEVLALNSYPAGKPISEVKRKFGLSEITKLASNENPLGSSPMAVEAAVKMSKELNLYPDASAYELKSSIAERWGVEQGQIFCGAGLDLLIRVICMTVVNSGDECIMGEVTFSRYDDAVKLMGGKPVYIPMKNYALDVEAMVDAITPRTKIIWFCNPNNPTGTMFTKREMERALERIPKEVLIVMDEAYYEYVTNPEYPDSISCLDEYPNLVVLRTFSKAYGLAGIRVGYGICNKELAKYFNAVVGPFDVNGIAQAAASAAIKDQEFVERSHNMNKEGKEFFYKALEYMDLQFIKTESNFIMIYIRSDDKKVYDELLRRGVIVKSGSSLGMPGFLRVSIGSMEQNKKFIEVLKSVLGR